MATSFPRPVGLGGTSDGGGRGSVPSGGPGGDSRAAVVDETPLEGWRRRLRAFAADLAASPAERAAWLTIAGLLALLVYSYWRGLAIAGSAWNDPQYSHGGLVPLFALGLLLWRREPIDAVSPSARLAGLGLIAAGQGLRLWAAYYRIVTIDMYTFVPTLAGVFLLAGGWRMLRWSWLPVATLIFMFPLPDEATRYILGPLQNVATRMSTFALQTLGQDAVRDGNRISLGDGQMLNVVDACSGLRMLTIFVWLSVMLAVVGDRPDWQKALVVGSAVPISLIVNATRITATGLMYTVDRQIAERIFHDWAGYLMMPLALALLYGVQAFADRLVVTETQAPRSLAGFGPVGPQSGDGSPGSGGP